MTDDEKRGYSKGYAAGRRRRSREIQAERRLAREQAFWQRAVLALAGHAFDCVGWRDGNKEPISTRPQRMALAAGAADDLLNEARKRSMV